MLGTPSQHASSETLLGAPVIFFLGKNSNNNNNVLLSLSKMAIKRPLRGLEWPIDEMAWGNTPFSKFKMS